MTKNKKQKRVVYSVTDARPRYEWDTHTCINPSGERERVKMAWPNLKGSQKQLRRSIIALGERVKRERLISLSLSWPFIDSRQLQSSVKTDSQANMAVLYRMMHKSQVTSPCSSSSSRYRCRPTNRVGPISLSDCCCIAFASFLKEFIPSSMCITGQNRRTDVFSPLINSMVLFYSTSA